MDYMPYSHPPPKDEVACISLCHDETCTQPPRITDRNNPRLDKRCGGCEAKVEQYILGDTEDGAYRPTPQKRRGSKYTFYCPVMHRIENGNVIVTCSRVNQDSNMTPTCRAHNHRMVLIFKPR